ncbi:WG repeat-containing protein [Hymenobacter translucens]|uniref:WG repeat-containing protein n=1 Tax=Hymenobacter translucens TaxID=2886507 RepID=UPI001D0F2392|nr:WG repeat-containing protein [Hymenobacter translucens]
MNASALLLLLMLMAASPATPQGTGARLLPFRHGDKWGYADRSRRLVLPLQYDEAGPFIGEIAWVKVGDKYGYIDGAGNPITPVQYARAGNFHRDRARVELNGEQFDIDPSGRRLDAGPAEEPEVDFLTQGDIVRKDGKLGFRFSVGQAVVPPLYDEIREDYRGLLFVRQGTRWGVINNKSKLVLPLAYDDIRVTAANDFVYPIVEQQGRFGYLDEDGKLLVAPRYKSAEPFVEGAARVVTIDGKPGYIDSRGKEYFED